MLVNVKVLRVFLMIDEGKCDWKVIAIDATLTTTHVLYFR